MSDQDDPILAAWPALEAPTDFAAAVLGRLAPAPPQRPRRRLWIGATLATLATAALILVALRPSAGAQRALGRETVAIGRRGLAVLEPGADVQHHVGWTGAAEVTQRAGSVFYRVERGGAFVVHTPAGDVTVHGTCFRVEVTAGKENEDMKAMKSGLVGASVGAALTAAVFVTVFEGKVSLANPRGSVALAAGESGSASTDRQPQIAAAGAPTATATRVPAPDSLAGLSPAELARRAEEQRTEIIGLHDQLRKLRADLESAQAKSQGKSDRKRPEFALEPTKEELAELAKTCTLQWDTPELGLEPGKISPKEQQQAGLSATEVQAINKAQADLHEQTARELRALYAEITGDRAHADSMTSVSLMIEINEKSSPADVQLAYQRLAQERAGQLAPPATTVGTTAIERAMRIVTSLGDRNERAIASVIGEQRAKDLRRRNNGFGSVHVSSNGCPGGRGEPE